MRIVNGKKKDNLVKKVLFGLFGLVTVLGSAVVSYLLISKFVSLIMYLLSSSVNLVSVVLICGGIPLGIGIVLLAKHAIRVEKVSEVNEQDEINEKMMRERLYVVNGRVKTKDKISLNSSNNYSYSFDNNYVDTEEEMIDDLDWLCLDKVSSDSLKSGYSRSKKRYNGKYIR